MNCLKELKYFGSLFKKQACFLILSLFVEKQFVNYGVKFFAILKNGFDNKPFPICMPKPHLQVKNGSFSSAIENLGSQLLLAACCPVSSSQQIDEELYGTTPFFLWTLYCSFRQVVKKSSFSQKTFAKHESMQVVRIRIVNQLTMSLKTLEI